MSKGRMAPSVRAEPHLRKELRDPVLAAELLNAAAAEDDPADFLYALRKVAEADGGIGSIAKRTKLNRQQLYKTLSAAGNPEFRTLWAILKAAGYSIAVSPIGAQRKRTPRLSGRSKNPMRARHAAQVEAA